MTADTQALVPMTIAEILEATQRAQIAFCLDKEKSFEVALARRVEAHHAAALQGRAQEGEPSDAADGARYRWLRSMWGLTILEDMLDQMPGRHPGAELDAAIDAAGAALAQAQAGERTC